LAHVRLERVAQRQRSGAVGGGQLDLGHVELGRFAVAVAVGRATALNADDFGLELGLGVGGRLLVGGVPFDQGGLVLDRLVAVVAVVAFARTGAAAPLCVVLRGGRGGRLISAAFGH